MKKLFYGLVFITLTSVSLSFAAPIANKQFIKDVRSNLNEYYKNQQAAEDFIKKTWQESLDNVLAGTFDVKATITKIKNMPEDLWASVSQESLVLLAKNIRYNVRLEDYYSKEFISDAHALFEVPFELYGKNNFLYPLKNGFFNMPLNEPLKEKLLDLFGNTKKRLTNVLEICRECNDDSSNIMSVFGDVDKETTALVDLLVYNSRSISNLCYSEEFKDECSRLLDNRYKITKIVKAFTFRFVSETILDDALNIPRGEFNPIETLAFKFISSQFSKNSYR